jgi:putative nucleotide binding protein
MSVDRSDRTFRSDDSYAHHHQPQRKYEEYAYILDFTQRGKSATVRGREGVIIQAIGEERLTLLELLGYGNATFEVGERLYRKGW